ncbi:SCO6880 family protein [Streptomyces sp. DT224]|uniref:SCO6880 family protein n=1 Tax=Streptomyces sp. DT224 TaxID=3393426 RepID=UPI003CF11736
MTDLSVAPVTVKFPHRSRRGILLGLSLPQLALVASMVALLLMTVVTTGLLGAVALTPVLATAAALVAVRRHGRSLIDWAPIVARYAHRRRTGQTLWLARPVTRPRQDGILHLPGTAASLKVVTPGDSANGAAAVHDPHQQTLTAIARVSARAFVLLDPATQNAHMSSWGRALAGVARTGHVAAVQVLERTVPDSGDTLARHWAQHGHSQTPVAGQIYSELVASAGPAAAPHETYLSISLDLKAARRLISQAGGGLPGAFTVMEQTTASIAQAARTAGLEVTGWLSAREIAAVVRTAYDPKALAALQQWSESGRAEADPSAAGPVVQVEEYDRLATDSARHATYWVENWPRVESYAGFLHGLMFTAGVRRSLSLIYVPQGIESALRDVQRRKAQIIADANERTRRGQVDSEEDSVEYADVKTRERQLIAGHADVAMTGLITVTAETDALLDAACAQIETAAVSAGVDLRRLNYQQPNAFTLAALPLARTDAQKKYGLAT